jgi:uncharacterized protein (TIGR02996 family)
MDDHAAFLRAIIATPNDDLPRLIYADFLDERGESARAELIRVQCELARLREPESKTFRPLCPTVAYHEGEGVCVSCTETTECRWHTLRRRERRQLGVWPAHPRWLGKPDPLVDTHPRRDVACDAPAIRASGARVSPIELYFRRGFVEEVMCTWADWSAHANTIRQLTPLRQVRLTEWSPPLHFTDTSRQRVHLETNPIRPRPLTCPTEPWLTGCLTSDVVARLLAAEWPGIRFDLPALRRRPLTPSFADATGYV